MSVIPAGGLSVIEAYEGLSGLRDDGKFYPVQEPADPPGVLTIGKGHVVKAHEMNRFNQGLTRQEVADLFAADLGPRVKRLTAIAGTCTDIQFGALLSLFYNNEYAVVSGGPGKHHRGGRHKQAAAAMLQYVYSGPQGAKKARLGLWRRRMTEALHYLTGDVHVANNKTTDTALYEKIKGLGLLPILKTMQPRNPFMSGAYLEKLK